jgi:hypothetical protein
MVLPVPVWLILMETASLTKESDIDILLAVDLEPLEISGNMRM